MPGGTRTRSRCAAALLTVSGCLAAAEPTWGASETSVRLADGVEIKPYVLGQLDMGEVIAADPPGAPRGGINLRRLRLGARADLPSDVEFGLIWDFGGRPGNRSRLYEAKVSFSGLKPFAFTAGAFKLPFTLEGAQSSADVLFLEDPSVIAVTSGQVAGSGRVGVAAAAQGDRWLAFVALTGGVVGPGNDGRQRAVVVRAAGLPVSTGDVDVHLGFSGAWAFRAPEIDTVRPSFALSDVPELALHRGGTLLKTGSIGASGMRLGGVEAGLSWSRLWAQGEAYRVLLDRSGSDGGTLAFSGWYAQAAYTLVGVPRQWMPDAAAWGAPSPRQGFDPAHGQWGAIEVGARYSELNLDDRDVRGGRQRVWTAGGSWYPLDYLRFILQYQYGAISGRDTPTSFQAIALRSQVFF